MWKQRPPFETRLLARGGRRTRKRKSAIGTDGALERDGGCDVDAAHPKTSDEHRRGWERMWAGRIGRARDVEGFSVLWLGGVSELS